MKRTLFPFRLQLFNEVDGAGVEPAAVDTQQQEQVQSEPVVIYGKAPEPGPEATELDAGSAQPGTENEPTVVAPEVFTFDFNQLTPELRPAAYDQFKNQFKDEFTQDFQSHFNRRFKDHKAVETRLGTVDPIIGNLMQFYGVKSVEELQGIIDQEIMPELASREGFTDPDKYRDYLNTRQKAEQFDAFQKQTQEQTQAEAQQNATVQKWIEQGKALQTTVAGFDLSAELSNPAFAQRLEQGYSVADAYQLAHMNDQITEAARRAQEATLQSIKSKNTRIPEVGLKPSAPAIVKNDPSKWSKKDMEEVRRRVIKGETITL